MIMPCMIGLALLAAVIGPSSTLSPDCISTTIISLPAVTIVNSLTLTYKAPFTINPPRLPPLIKKTQTIVIPNRCPDGQIEARTYTIIGDSPDSSPQVSGMVRTVTRISTIMKVTTTRRSPTVKITAQSLHGPQTSVPATVVGVPVSSSRFLNLSPYLPGFPAEAGDGVLEDPWTECDCPSEWQGLSGGDIQEDPWIKCDCPSEWEETYGDGVPEDSWTECDSPSEWEDSSGDDIEEDP